MVSKGSTWWFSTHYLVYPLRSTETCRSSSNDQNIDRTVKTVVRHGGTGAALDVTGTRAEEQNGVKCTVATNGKTVERVV